MMTRQKRRKGGSYSKEKENYGLKFFFFKQCRKETEKNYEMQQRAQNNTGLSYATFFQFSLNRKNGHDNRKETGLSQMGNHQETMWSITTSTMEKACCKYKGENNLTYLITDNLPPPHKKI